MKSNLSRSFAVLFFVLLSISTLVIVNVNCQEEDSWIELVPMQEPRVDHGVATVDGKIYAIGNGPNHPIDKVEEYNPQTNTWTNKKSAPEPLDHLSVAVHHGKIYCFSAGTGKTYAYTPLYDSWETKTQLPNTSDNIIANTLNDKIYVIDGSWKTLHVYYPINNSWTTGNPPLYELYFKLASSVVFDDRLHVFGANSLENSHQIYDPTTNSWSVGTPLIEGYYSPVVSATSGFNAPKRIYVFGLKSNIFDATSLNGQSYDPKTNTWITCAQIPNSHLRGQSTVVEDKIYVIGGSMIFLGQTFPMSNNILYTPIGYGTPDPSYTPPPTTPSPSPPEPEFLTTIALASVVTLSIVAVGILAYYKKRRT